MGKWSLPKARYLTDYLLNKYLFVHHKTHTSMYVYWCHTFSTQNSQTKTQCLDCKSSFKELIPLFWHFYSWRRLSKEVKNRELVLVLQNFGTMHFVIGRIGTFGTLVGTCWSAQRYVANNKQFFVPGFYSLKLFSPCVVYPWYTAKFWL